MSKIIKAPHPLENGHSIFLAGSIEMGTAENWQACVECALTNMDIIIYNPRRDDWDSTWIQSQDDPQFREQVKWELAALEQADLIAMYFDPATKSPISLLELGLFARTGKLLVCCPAGFWRKGNVDIICSQYEIKQVATLGELISQAVSAAQMQSRL